MSDIDAVLDRLTASFAAQGAPAQLIGQVAGAVRDAAKFRGEAPHATVAVFCNDKARNFHKRHGRSWVDLLRKRDDTGLRSADTPPSNIFDSHDGARGWYSTTEPIGWTSLAMDLTEEQQLPMRCPCGYEHRADLEPLAVALDELVAAGVSEVSLPVLVKAAEIVAKETTTS